MTEERKRKTVLAPSPQAKRRKEESSSSSSSLPSKVFTKHNLEGVEGCIVIPDFITQKEEKELLKELNKEEWMTSLKRRVQHYGYKYDYKSKKITKDDYLGPLPEWSSFLVPRFLENSLLLSLPDQMIVNEYEPGQGISQHIDKIDLFGDRIISVSLGSPTVMVLSRDATKKPIVLPRRSLLVLSKDARFKWKHAIPARKTDSVEDCLSGKQMKIIRTKRVSLTFRNMKL